MGVCLLDLRDFNPRSREGSDPSALLCPAV